jgi:hypothetical protein
VKVDKFNLGAVPLNYEYGPLYASLGMRPLVIERPGGSSDVCQLVLKVAAHILPARGMKSQVMY